MSDISHETTHHYARNQIARIIDVGCGISQGTVGSKAFYDIFSNLHASSDTANALSNCFRINVPLVMARC